MYTCTCCNYSTAHQSNYKRHIETSKHKKIIEELQKQKSINAGPLMLVIARLEESNARLEESNKQLQENYTTLQERMSVLEKSVA